MPLSAAAPSLRHSGTPYSPRLPRPNPYNHRRSHKTNGPDMTENEIREKLEALSERLTALRDSL